MIKIDKDPQINRAGNLKPLLTKDHLKGQRVKSLLDDNNAWREDIIHQPFIPQDAKDILNMPLGNKNSIDKISWHPNNKGIFSVKSAYDLAMESNSRQEASQSDHNKASREWKSIWAT